MEDTVREVALSLGVLASDDQLIALDSLKMVELVVALEQATGIDGFQVAFSYEDFLSVPTIVNVLERARRVASGDAPAPRTGGGVRLLASTLETNDAPTALATVHQQLFWCIDRDSPGADCWLRFELAIDGSLDRGALERSLDVIIAAHSLFRTAYRELAGELQLVVLGLDEAPRFALGHQQCGTDADRDDVLARGAAELARQLAPEHGRTLYATLFQFGHEQHVLQLVAHHIAVDGPALSALARRLLTLYVDEHAGRLARETPPFQYVDYARALERWAETPAGRVAATYWRERVAGAAPVDVACDLPRTAVDARRDTAPHGIAASPMHPHISALMPKAINERLAALAREENTTGPIAYLAGLVWLLHRETGQAEMCVEAVTSLRGAHPGLHDIQGMMTTWLLYRVDLAGCTTYRDALRRTTATVVEAQEHPIIAGYYQFVPHTVRRVVFNYVPPPGAPLPQVDGLRIVPHTIVSEHMKRPWDLHVNVIDRPGAPSLRCSGNAELFTHDRLVVMVERYLVTLAAI
jgi:hypothetical protein